MVAARRRSTRSTRARSRTPTATASATCAGIAAHLDHLDGARRRRDLAVAVLPLADGRLRLRRRRLLRRRPGVRHARRLRPRWSPTAHARGIRVVIDWVPNHTSDRHPWFEESRARPRRPEARLVRLARRRRTAGRRTTGARRSRRSAARGPRRGARGQWYLHSFLPEQPDLNWDNPEVEAAMHDVLRFWLDRGVDGFRHRRRPQDRQGPGAARQRAARRRATTRTGRRSTRGCAGSARVRRRVRRPHARRRGLPARPATASSRYVDLGRRAAPGAQLRLPATSRGTPTALRASIDDFEALTAERAWPAWFLANHDQPRVATPLRRRRPRPARARAVALMLYALRGTPFLYQGEELGLPDAEIPPDRRRRRRRARPRARADPVGPPGPAAGFTTGEPWLPFVDEAERSASRPRPRDPALDAQPDAAAGGAAARARRPCRTAPSARCPPPRACSRGCARPAASG